jgi:hypothetical protein
MLRRVWDRAFQEAGLTWWDLEMLELRLFDCFSQRTIPCRTRLLIKLFSLQGRPITRPGSLGHRVCGSICSRSFFLFCRRERAAVFGWPVEFRTSSGSPNLQDLCIQFWQQTAANSLFREFPSTFRSFRIRSIGIWENVRRCLSKLSRDRRLAESHNLHQTMDSSRTHKVEPPSVVPHCSSGDGRKCDDPHRVAPPAGTESRSLSTKCTNHNRGRDCLL